MIEKLTLFVKTLRELNTTGFIALLSLCLVALAFIGLQVLELFMT